MNPSVANVLSVTSTWLGQAVPTYKARRGWMARVEMALFASICGYFALSLLNAASLI